MDRETKPRASASLQALLEETPGDLRLGEFIDGLGARAFGLSLLFLSLATLLVAGAPGLSTVLGLPIVLLSLQIAAGRTSFWLPQKLADTTVSHARLEGIVKRAQAILGRLERLVKPRLNGLAKQEQALGAYCALLGIVLALPVLFGNFLPALALMLIALGLIEEDGGAILAGIVTGVISIVYAVAFFALGAAAIKGLLGV